MKLRIFDSINDSFLQSEWERLEKESDVFPQCTYHWCSTWWKYLGGERGLHIVMALAEDEKAIAIAPLCIERTFGIPVLRSFPIHFGDFYTFITSNGSSQSGINGILEYMASNRLWQWVRLEQVSVSSNLVHNLRNRNYREKLMTSCVIIDFSGLEWNEYFTSLKAHFRQEVRRRLRKINTSFKPELTIAKTWEEYLDKFNVMVNIYQNRWIDDNVPTKGIKEIACLRDGIKRQFESGKVIYYELLFDNVPVAYRLGFLHKNVYYQWHTSFNTDYRNYHPGIMIMEFIIKHLMENGVSKINFMAGNYAWKLDWSLDQRTEANYMFTSGSTNVAAFLLNYYYHDFRDKLKDAYHSIMHYRTLRAISRNVIRLRQKITGMR